MQLVSETGQTIIEICCYFIILGLKSKILKVTTLFEWRRWRKCQKSWLLLEGELMKTFWTRLINQCRWKNMILILKGRVWPGGCYWKSGSGQWEVPSDILENWELWLLATTLHIYMSDSLLLSHIFKSYSIRYVTREELVAAMEKVTQGLREEIRSFFQAFSCGWHHQWWPLNLMISVICMNVNVWSTHCVLWINLQSNRFRHRFHWLSEAIYALYVVLLRVERLYFIDVG